MDTPSTIAQPAATVQLTFNYVYEDLFETKNPWRIHGPIVLGWFMIVIALAGFDVINRWNDPWMFEDITFRIEMWIFAIAMIALLVINRQRKQRRHRRDWQREMSAKQYAVAFSPGGITWGSADAAVTPWSDYAGYMERPEGFWLFQIPSKGTNRWLIPRRTMTDEQALIVRELFRQHYSRAKGFPVDLVTLKSVDVP